MKLSKGFTIIELIVVIAIFLFVIGAAISIFLTVLANQKKVLADQQLINQVSYVEEYMSKALRMASTDQGGTCLIDNTGVRLTNYAYQLTKYDTTLGAFKGIRFINQSDNNGIGACWEFFLSGSGTKADPYILEKENLSDGTPVAIPLTPTSLQFNPSNPIRFSIDGLNGSTGQTCVNATHDNCGFLAYQPDHAQPRITIMMNVKSTIDTLGSYKTIQTTVSQRDLNVPSQ